MPDFSAPAKEHDFSPIPEETLLWVIVNVRGAKVGAEKGTKYWDCEFTVDQGQPYAKRKIFQNIMDAFAQQNSAEARDMGYGQVKRMLESGRGASPENPSAYQLPDHENFMMELNGLRVAVRVGIERGALKEKSNPDGDRYDDKNCVKEFLSPVAQAKSAVQGFQELIEGKPQTEGASNQSAGGQSAAQASTSNPIEQTADWMTQAAT